MENYRCIVTGGAQGIGLAIVESLLKSKGKVYLLDIDAKQGKKIEGELQSKYGSNKVKFLKCDVTNDEELEGAIRTAAKEMGGLNVLCNNAGFGRPFYDTSRWKEELDINLKAPILGTMLGLELMGVDKGGSGGVIVQMSSLGSTERINPELHGPIMFPTYYAAKAGIIAYTRSIAPIATVSKVRVNCVCPDATDTRQFRETLPELTAKMRQGVFDPFMQSMPSEEQAGEEGGQTENLAGEFQTPDEVADCVMKIIQDPTKTGESWIVSKNIGTYCHNFPKSFVK